MMRFQLSDLNFLEPLLKWRILDFKSLRLIAGYPFSDSAFRKKLNRLERSGIIKTTRDFNRGRKYAYLSQKGKDFLKPDESYDCVAEGHERHDLLVSHILQYFEKFKGVRACYLEHELKGEQQFRSKNQVIPDGLIKTNHQGKELSIAIELEITRKSKNRIESKYERYLQDKKIDTVFWFFTSEGVKKSYINHFELLHGGTVKKFIYFEIKNQVLHECIENLKIEYLGELKEINDLGKILGSCA